MKRQGLVCLMLLTMFTSSCGSSAGGHSEDARKVGERYLRALASEDGRRICRLLTTGGQERVIEAFRNAGPTRSAGPARCDQAASLLYRGLGRHIGRGQIVRVDVVGDSATLTLAYDAPHAGRIELVLRLVDGRWLVDREGS